VSRTLHFYLTKFQLLGEKGNKTKDAICMRYNRQRFPIHAAKVSTSPPITEEATDQVPERAEEKGDNCHVSDTARIDEEAESADM
jgi:hypothetical protein